MKTLKKETLIVFLISLFWCFSPLYSSAISQEDILSNVDYWNC